MKNKNKCAVCDYDVMSMNKRRNVHLCQFNFLCHVFVTDEIISCVLLSVWPVRPHDVTSGSRGFLFYCLCPGTLICGTLESLWPSDEAAGINNWWTEVCWGEEGRDRRLFSIFIWVTPDCTFQNTLRCFFWVPFIPHHWKAPVNILTVLFPLIRDSKQEKHHN